MPLKLGEPEIILAEDSVEDEILLINFVKISPPRQEKHIQRFALENLG